MEVGVYGCATDDLSSHWPIDVRPIPAIMRVLAPGVCRGVYLIPTSLCLKHATLTVYCLTQVVNGKPSLPSVLGRVDGPYTI